MIGVLTTSPWARRISRALVARAIENSPCGLEPSRIVVPRGHQPVWPGIRRRGARAIVAGAMATGIGLGSMPAPVASEPSGAPPVNPLSGNEVAIKEGRSWYRAVCAFCHGERAEGGRGHGVDLRGFDKGFRHFVEIVKSGRDVPGRAYKMPAWNGVLSDEQIYQIGAYLETLTGGGANGKDPADPRKP